MNNTISTSFKFMGLIIVPEHYKHASKHIWAPEKQACRHVYYVPKSIIYVWMQWYQ